MRRVIAPDIVSLLNSGVPGLVVVRDSSVAGILTAGAVSDYLAEHVPMRSGTLGDGQLHGDPAVRPLTLTCSTCGTRNVVRYFVAGAVTCAGAPHPHALTITWD